MASAKVSVVHRPASSEIHTEMVIVGGGICGIIAAKMCTDRKIPYKLIERERILGGNWHSLANSTSYLQAFEPNYRWDNNYRLGQDPLIKHSAKNVLETLQRYASDFDVPANTLFSTEADAVVQEKTGTYRVVVRDLSTNKESHIITNFLCVTPGILSTSQWTAEERGVKGTEDFLGEITLGGRDGGKDSSVSHANLVGKKVIILGSGSFAAEALEAADRAGADHITILGRPRYRWILPFSRQNTITAIANAPIIPWSLKYRFALWYLRTCFYEPCGLQHWAPSGGPGKMDYSGQCNDGYFRLAWQGRLTCELDGLERLEGHDAVLSSGRRLPCDMLVVASGCKYNLDPPFLRDLNLGFKDLHNFAFLGPNPRIGCASDFVFAYVPFGPIKQLEMFFHSVECCQKGLEEDIRSALLPTPLPNHGEGMHTGGRMAGHHTFFEYNHWWSGLGRAQEARVAAMLRTLDVGRPIWSRTALRVAAAVGNFASWVGTLYLAFLELWRYPVYGPGVGDRHYRPITSGEEKPKSCSTIGQKKGVKRVSKGGKNSFH